MDTIGFIGMGKIGLPICEHLIKGGYCVLGYRRGSLADFEKLGGVAAKSPAQVGAQTDIVFTCLPSDAALEEVVCGPNGLVHSARPGQIVVEFGSHSIPVKEKYIAPLAAEGAIFLDGEVSGTPGMVAQRKGAIYIAGDQIAAQKIEPVIKSFAGSLSLSRCLRFGDQGQVDQQSPCRASHRRHGAGDGDRAAVGRRPPR